jgi:8-oxo-dGTP diphosphatase
MSAYLVRHAKAGRRSEWRGDDRLRPLSKAGWRQAEAIAERLGDEKITGLWSSPFTRCVQTLEPLAQRTDLLIAHDERLSEAARLADALALLRAAGDGAVLCSHGDVVPDIVDGLIQHGAELHGEPDWRKASIWILELDGDDVSRLRAEPPPK